MKEWDRHQATTWKDFKHPPRLSKTELAIVEPFIKKTKKDAKVLILGSTIELRELCYKHNIKPYVVDYKKEVYEEWTKMLKRKGEDFFIHKNWLKMNFPFKFDLILGDLAFLMLPWKDQKKLAVKIRSLLKPNGITFQRMWVTQPEKHNDMKKIVRQAVERIKKGVHPQEAILLQLATYYYDYKKDCFSCRNALKKMKADVDKKVLPKKIYDHFHNIWYTYKNPCTMRPKKEFGEMLSKYFKIKKIKYGKEVFRSMSPMYFMVRK